MVCVCFVLRRPKEILFYKIKSYLCLPCAQTKLNLLSSLCANQRQNPCPGPQASTKILVRAMNDLLKKSIVSQVEGKYETHFW